MQPEEHFIGISFVAKELLLHTQPWLKFYINLSIVITLLVCQSSVLGLLCNEIYLIGIAFFVPPQLSARAWAFVSLSNSKSE
jgi:hypothetical protein